jgi:hypothetical protein
MTARRLAALLAAWSLVVAVLCFAVHRRSSLRPPHERVVVASKWKGGALVARAIGPDVDATTKDASLASADGTLVIEHVRGVATVPKWPEILAATSFVPGRDGARVTQGDKVAWLTTDDLLSRQAYDREVRAGELTLGVDLAALWALAGERLGTTPAAAKAHASLERVRFEREIVGAKAVKVPSAATFDDDDARAAMFAAATHVARGVSEDGRLRYLFDATTNRTRSGYDWPRHAGTSYFLALASRLGAPPEVRVAALRVAYRLRDVALVRCGAHACVGTDDPVEVGSSALAAIAFVEMARSGLAPELAAPARDLADFLRAQQRPDGELMHWCGRDGTPVDRQEPFFSGEAALALSRVHGLLGRAEDLEAARRAVAFLTGPRWSFFGDRYWYDEEHWTCQAAAELHARTHDDAALDFCVRFAQFTAALQPRPSNEDTLDLDGALWLGPGVTPRLTPVASRSEAMLAVLDAMREGESERRSDRASDIDDIDTIERATRRSLALLTRWQMPAGAAHLLADPLAAAGASPETEVSWTLRVDQAQHTGCAFARFIERKR